VSPDIRAGMALVGAALCAKGQSIIRNVEQIDRGYERVEEKLRSLGARIERGKEIKEKKVTVTFEVTVTFYQVIRWARQDSNLQPTGYEPVALPLSYGPD
jgi:formate-dependent phosphoribosylglycinamide formyltransferase (GAR transformylase)